MNRIQALYEELKEKYGKPQGQWSLWCKRPKTRPEKELVAIEAILTQRANWKNVQLAVANLKEADCLGLKDILATEDRHLSRLVRPSGFYRQKAERLKILARFLMEECGGIGLVSKISLSELRPRLLALKGVGPETADDILLYGLEKPVFVIDEYTRRLARSLNLSRVLSYQPLQELFEKNLKKDYRSYQDFHALIVINGKIIK
jgi:endonuclease-3 related protein